MRRRVELAEVFQTYGPAYRHSRRLSRAQARVMHAIEVCRTAALGGHVDECDHCGALRISYNSCRNRHCPKCQSLAQERWLEQQRRCLLPVSYFHLVFTVPATLAPLLRWNQALGYDLLFRCAAAALLELTADPRHLGGQVGATALLHTWSQTLTYHPHVHMIVTGGGLSADGDRWIPARPAFLVPVRALSQLFRGKLLAALRAAHRAGKLVVPVDRDQPSDPAALDRLLAALYAQPWVVYCKPPFAGPQRVLEYLGRYTHRVALSNDRLRSCQHQQVTFGYRDRAHGNRRRRLTLPAEEFIRRFLLHVLPDRFVRVRHYGLLGNRNRQRQIARCQQLLQAQPTPPPPAHRTWQQLLLQLTGVDPSCCRVCGQGHWRTTRLLVPLAQRAPPHAIGLPA
jgi:hypothetical protein